MPDITQLSDEELLSLSQGAPPKRPIQDLSDDELRGLADAPQGEYTGFIVPWRVDEKGEGHLAVPRIISGAVASAINAARLPGDVVTGKVPTIDPETGHVSDEVIGRAAELGMWAMPVTPGVRSGETAIPTAGRALKQAIPETPSASSLRAASRSGYKKIRDLGVDYDPNAVRNMMTAARADLEKEGFGARAVPRVHGIIDDIFDDLTLPKDAPAGSSVVVPLGGLDTARRNLKKIAGNFNDPTEQDAALRAIRWIDDFVEAADPKSVVAGPAATAARIQREARGNYAAYKRSERITGLSTKAERRAKAANSGWNIDNTIRQRVASLLDNPKQIAGFSDEEIAALDVLAQGTRGRNAVRWLGNVMGGGGGLGGYVTGAGGAGLGVATGLGPAGVAAATLAGPAAGAGFKATGNAMTRRAMMAADDFVRQRSPLFQNALRQAPMVPADPSGRDVFARAIAAALAAQKPDNSVDPIMRVLIGSEI